MTDTAWQRTEEWESDPQQPREHLISIAIDTARNGEAILLVRDEKTDTLLTGAALRSRYDLEEVVNVIVSQLNFEVDAELTKRAKPQSRLIDRTGRTNRGRW